MGTDPRLTALQRVMSRWRDGGSEERLVVVAEDDWPELAALLEPLAERFEADRITSTGAEDGDDRYLFVDDPVATTALADLLRDLLRAHGFAVAVEPAPAHLAADQQVRVHRTRA